MERGARPDDINIDYSGIDGISVKAAKVAEKTPILGEFAKFIVHVNQNGGSGKKEHWRPNNRMCHPLNVSYDFIIKLETLEDNSKHLMKNLKMEHSRFPLLNVRRKK
ncbi:hypothetical protein CAPTEDRAFT_190916 [Capitella teleta]|uniref:Carbohydrate sulfotransferase n=1 Tax=Capitella teleta TaxID=283909 RepID=R7UQE5_CAPTE|nr:hypothetical protein CAPTEDRAFT_190916 [Capitella teleta]|eukprot:ELU08415.1 hypothetical protein CAPTEDRAFT_190916 [Capitella teleta]